MKHMVFSVLALCLLICSIPGGSAAGISAESYVLMEAESGRVLAERRAHESRPIASITKLMTALVALESGRDLEETYEISRQWTGVEGSSIYLIPGEQISLKTLLYGMLLRSGNDAALAVAGVCGGSVDDFVAQMNCKAETLHMNDSHFENPNGLQQEGHYSSAYDMALLARACLANQTLAKMVSTRTVTMGGRTFVNHNKLLWRYPGCIGMKTGYTESAGRTLVSAARRDGVTLICVTLNAPDDWADHTALLDQGFSRCRRVSLTEKNTLFCRIPVKGSVLPCAEAVAADNVDVVLTDNERPVPELVLRRSLLNAPVKAGTMLGQIRYKVNKRVVGQTDLVTADNIPFDLTVHLWSGLSSYWK